MLPIKVLRKPRKCQNCNNKTVVEISYGDPTEWVMQMAEEGKLVLGGCIISNLSPQWQCAQCDTQYIKETS